MAVIAKNSLTKGAPALITETELTGTDSIDTRDGTLFVRNDTGGSVTINIDGDGGSTVVCSGAGTIDVSGGYDIVVAAGETQAIRLPDIAAYLNGTIAVSGGAASVFAYILQ